MLATRLSAMMPQAVKLRIALKDGRTTWPHLDVTASDAADVKVSINRTQAQTAARWIIRAHREAGWQHPRTFDLRTALLDGGAR
ncbi:transcriptional regulator [Streptomyces sp. NPDC051561]|uniref:transcriptional regulator n=1 Tax=Streptomyces sp. NPDC051561 TaxID=3365658 RepID=UPI00379365A5